MKLLLSVVILVGVFLPVIEAQADAPRLIIDTGGHKALIIDVIFSSDGRFLVSASTDKTVHVWYTRTGEVVRTIRGRIGKGSEGKIFAAALFPNNRILAVGDWSGKSGAIEPCCGDIRLYDFQTEEVVGLLQGHTSVVYGLAISPDGQYLASSNADNTVRLWDIASGKNLLTIFVGSNQEWVAWTPEGYYTSSLNGDQYIGWHVNRGGDPAAEFYPVYQFQKQFYRPDVVAAYLESRGNQRRMR